MPLCWSVASTPTPTVSVPVYAPASGARSAPPAILTGRKAKCYYYPNGGKCGRCPEPVDSALGMAFFEYHGPLSEDARTLCTCGFRDITHPDVAAVNPYTGRTNTGHPFVPRGPQEFDRYFCGCWGWD